MICASIYPRPTGAVNQEPRLVRGLRQGSGGRRQAGWSHSPHCGEAHGAMTGSGASSRGTRCSWSWQERWGGTACSHGPQLSWASSFSPLVQRQPIWQAYDIGYVHWLAHLHLLYFITALEHKNLWHLLTKTDVGPKRKTSTTNQQCSWYLLWKKSSYELCLLPS